MSEIKRKSKKATWSQAILSIFWPLLAVLSIRWALFEPFVIPSGSLIPTLLVHDHIVVKKFAYGVKFPFTDVSILRWGQIHKGDIVVFRYPLDPDVYYVKRVVGLPGDKISIKNSQMSINDQLIKTIDSESFSAELTAELDAQNLFEDGYSYFQETLGEKQHLIRHRKDLENSFAESEFLVPEHQYFMMGDNRDESSDSRVWGFVKEDLIVGQAWKIWLSCDETLESASFICDPKQIRWQRLFKAVQ